MEHFPVKPSKYLVCVSDSTESRVALKLACFKAARRGGYVDILHVIPPADFQSLSTVAERMQEEQHKEAEALLQSVAEEVYSICRLRPSILVKEGQVGECILQAAIEDQGIDALVLGVAESSKGGSTLVAWLAAQLGGKLQVPLLLVPGNLDDAQIMELV